MGLWKTKINEAHNASEKGEYNDTQVSENSPAEDYSTIKEKEIDWEERHFQICLALLSNTTPHTSIAYKSIIKKADTMITCLKEHLEEQTDGK